MGGSKEVARQVWSHVLPSKVRSGAEGGKGKGSGRLLKRFFRTQAPSVIPVDGSSYDFTTVVLITTVYI